ncbi:hypothetical protein K4F52_008746 [Lecanicillium sp. MT-2017a]|nr:hypothetical protein K4F52_008746 [Lecanicillium sp. MT-2017a]
MAEFIGRRSRPTQTASVRTIHEELAQWKDGLPAQLRIESYDDPAPGEEPSLYQLQALALQLAYDNLQIVLHRTVAFGDGNNLQVSEEGLFSLRRLTEAAMQTAGLHKFPNALKACRRTHANMHVGITLFTAGVVLCVVCLQQPLSSTSQRAKMSVMHIVRVCQDASTSQHIVSKQSIAILERLVTVILQLENQIITGKSAAPSVMDEGDFVERDLRTGGFGEDNTTAVVDSSTQDFLQQVLSQQAQRPWPEARHGALGGIADSTAPPELTTSDDLGSFDWDASLSALTDSGLGDASQLWMWAQNADFDTSPPRQ